MDTDDVIVPTEIMRLMREFSETYGRVHIPDVWRRKSWPSIDEDEDEDDLTKERDALRAEVESLRRRLEEEKRRRM